MLWRIRVHLSNIAIGRSSKTKPAGTDSADNFAVSVQAFLSQLLSQRLSSIQLYLDLAHDRLIRTGGNGIKNCLKVSRKHWLINRELVQ